MTGKKVRKPVWKAKVGRPTEYGPEMSETVLRLASTGLTEQEIANIFQVETWTITRWEGEHPEFSAALKEGKAIADARVKRRLYERALGGHRITKQKAFVIRGQIKVVEIWEELPPDTTAQIFWLKNRDPENWREKVDHEYRHVFNFVGAIPTEQEWIEHYASEKEPLVIDQRVKEEGDGQAGSDQAAAGGDD